MYTAGMYWHCEPSVIRPLLLLSHTALPLPDPPDSLSDLDKWIFALARYARETGDGRYAEEAVLLASEVLLAAAFAT